MFITVKVITKLNLGHRSKFEIEFQKISRCLQTTENWSIHVVVLPRTAKKCTKSYNARTEPVVLLIKYNARAQPLFCLLSLLFSDVPVVVAVVVFLNSLNDAHERSLGYAT